MAESIISAGVYARENDISYVQPAPIAAGAAFLGPTVKGPDNLPTVVTSYSDYTRKFGDVFLTGSETKEFLTSIAVKNYFAQGGQTALVTRIVSGSYTAAESTRISSNIVGASGSNATGSILVSNLSAADITGSGEVITLVDANHNYYTIIAAGWGYEYNYYSETLDYGYHSPNAGGSSYTISHWTASFANFINTQAAEIGVTVVTGGASLQFTGSSAVNGLRIFTNLQFGQSTGSAQPAATLGGGTPSISTNAFTLKTLSKGALLNNAGSINDPGAQYSDGSLISGSIENLRWEVSNVVSSSGTFTLSIRRGNDSLNNKQVLETFNNLSLDPFSPNYIESVIGTQFTTIDTSDTLPFVTTRGNYPNRSNYVRIESVTETTPNYLANDGTTINTRSDGSSFATLLPVVQSGSFYNGQGTIKAGSNYFSGIGQGTNSQGLVAANYTTAIDVLSNRDDFQFNVISAPGMIHTHTGIGNVVNNKLIALAEDRGDCIAVVDLVATGSNIQAVTGVSTGLNSSYAATYWPWVQVQSGTGKNEYVPAGTLVPGVYAFTDAAAAPWFAPAGLVRGGLPGVIQAERKLTKPNRDDLYSAKVNPIATFPGTGIAIFGQKTLQTKASALDRVNVRRLLIALKKFIGDQAKNLIFEQNTIATRNSFLSIVNPYLSSVVERQGLYAYRVIMDDSNNTADVVDRNQLIGQILIQPAKTIEFVVLDFTIQPTGATFT